MRSAAFQIDRIFADEGVSGVFTACADRPAAAHLLRATRPGDAAVVRWVDRLRRNYDDVTNIIKTFMKQGVTVKTVIDGFTFERSTTEPVQKVVRDSLIAFMAAIVQRFEERVPSFSL